MIFSAFKCISLQFSFSELSSLRWNLSHMTVLDPCLWGKMQLKALKARKRTFDHRFLEARRGLMTHEVPWGVLWGALWEYVVPVPIWHRFSLLCTFVSSIIQNCLSELMWDFQTVYCNKVVSWGMHCILHPLPRCDLIMVSLAGC